LIEFELQLNTKRHITSKPQCKNFTTFTTFAEYHAWTVKLTVPIFCDFLSV